MVERSPHHLKVEGSNLATTSNSVTENDVKIFEKVFGQSDGMVVERTPHHLKVAGFSPATTATVDTWTQCYKTIAVIFSW